MDIKKILIEIGSFLSGAMLGLIGGFWAYSSAIALSMTLANHRIFMSLIGMLPFILYLCIVLVSQKRIIFKVNFVLFLIVSFYYFYFVPTCVK